MLLIRAPRWVLAGALFCLCAVPVSGAADYSVSSAIGAHFDTAGRLQIDVHYDCALDPPLAELSSAGLEADTRVKAPPYCVVEGWVLPGALALISSVPGVTRVALPEYVRRTTPVAPLDHQASRIPRLKDSSTATGIDVNGVHITHADQFVAQTGISGTGVTVGVQSSGVDSLQTVEARGELPASVAIVYPNGSSSAPSGDDEGTMLLEEIHAMAPGANAVFCDPQTFADYTSCLQQLITAGATILVDDVALVSQDLVTADNEQVQAVESILANNPQVALYTSAGNSNGSYWEGTYTPEAAPAGTPALSCAPSSGGNATTDNYVAQFGQGTAATLTVSGSGASFPLLLAWADPATQTTPTHFDVYVYNGGSLAGCMNSSDTSINANGHQMSLNLSLPAGAYTVYVATPDNSSTGTFIKLWAGGDGLTQITPSTAGSTLSPQAFAAGSVSIGAVDGSDGIGSTIESYSSLGPVTFPLPTCTAAPACNQVQAPTLVAPDAINVDATGTLFTSLLWQDPTGSYSSGIFKGTSASAPNAAGVAILIRAAFPSLNRSQLNQVLEQGAAWLGATGTTPPDGTFGYGRVDALGALAQAEALTGAQPAAPPASSAPATGDTESGAASGTTAGTTSGTTTGGRSGGGSLGFVDLAVLGLLLAARAGWPARRRVRG